MVFLLIASIVLFVFLGIYVFLPYIRYRHYRQFGDGQFFPFLGEIVLIVKSFQKHGDVDYQKHHLLDNDKEQRLFVTNNAHKVKLILVEPEIIKDFFMNGQYYIKDNTLIANIKRIVNGGIITSEGNRWKISRRLFSKAFHFDYLQSLSGNIEGIARKKFQSLIEGDSLNAVDTIDCMQEITGTVIILSFFGETLENVRIRGMKLTQALAYALSTLGEQTFSIPFFLFGKGFYEIGLTKKHRELSSFLQEIKTLICSQVNLKINEIQAEIKGNGKTENKSILAELVSSRQIDEISRDELYQNFTTFYLAGMDTTGHLLGMIVYYVTQNKEIYKSLQQEVDNNEDSSPQALAQMPYMNAVIKEALRYYGPGNLIFDRVATEDHHLGGILIKKGTLVTPYAICTHRNTKFYDDPHLFNPSRWLGKKDTDQTPYSYLPFSAGQRNCIGQHLAQLESRVILNLFVKTFDFSCPADYKLIMGSKFLVEPVNPLQIKLTPRKQA